MARRCGCASDSCSCIVVAGGGITVNGTGSERNPYVVHSNVSDIETGFDVQYNNSDVVNDVHRLDFRGSAVTVVPGTDEAVVTITVPDPTTGAIIPTGTIWMFGSSLVPAGWLLCDGSTVLIGDQPNLFAAIGTRFGGDGTTNFMLPNMQDRFVVGISGSKIVGATGGSASKPIGVTNLPPHQHTIAHDHGAFNTGSGGGHDHTISRRENVGTSGDATARGGGVAVGSIQTGTQGGHIHSINVPPFPANNSGSVGSGTPLDVMPPFLALAFIIKV